SCPTPWNVHGDDSPSILRPASAPRDPVVAAPNEGLTSGSTPVPSDEAPRRCGGSVGETARPYTISVRVARRPRAHAGRRASTASPLPALPRSPAAKGRSSREAPGPQPFIVRGNGVGSPLHGERARPRPHGPRRPPPGLGVAARGSELGGTRGA